jgi:quercetin dioxygenase-like cupin family protein
LTAVRHGTLASEAGSRAFHDYAHTHAKSAFIYATVLEGAIRSAVNGAPEKVYHAGENLYEEPGNHHDVSANASDTEPARLLAVFIVNGDETELTIDKK